MNRFGLAYQIQRRQNSSGGWPDALLLPLPFRALLREALEAVLAFRPVLAPVLVWLDGFLDPGTSRFSAVAADVSWGAAFSIREGLELLVFFVSAVFFLLSGFFEPLVVRFELLRLCEADVEVDAFDFWVVRPVLSVLFRLLRGVCFDVLSFDARFRDGDFLSVLESGFDIERRILCHCSCIFIENGGTLLY